MKSEIFRRLERVPAIVHIVLAQATRRRAEGTITEDVFKQQIQRLEREELETRGLTLVVQNPGGGRTRFIVRETVSGAERETVNFGEDGTRQPVTFESLARDQSPSSPKGSASERRIPEVAGLAGQPQPAPGDIGNFLTFSVPTTADDVAMSNKGGSL